MPPIEKGAITYTPDNVPDFDLETKAKYHCDPGFLLVGNVTRECVECEDGTGVFNGEAPLCIGEN